MTREQAVETLHELYSEIEISFMYDVDYEEAIERIMNDEELNEAYAE